MLKMLGTYFILGLLYDTVFTRFCIAVQKREAFLSGLLSFILTCFACLVLYNLVLGPDAIRGILSYGAGCSIGTYGTVLYKSRKKQDKKVELVSEKS